MTATPAARMVFVNLPVRDLARSVEFFTKLGFTFNRQFTDETATMMVINDTAMVMLLAEERFKEFTPKQLADAGRATEVLVAVSAESRAAVDDLADRALREGGTPVRDPEDHGYMYGRSFNDLDGHIWEVVWMDPNAIER